MHKELNEPTSTTGSFETPEYRRMTQAPAPKQDQGASEYITISVAEYHCLTKVATMLELLMKARPYERDTLLRVMEATLDEMMGGDGAAE